MRLQRAIVRGGSVNLLHFLCILSALPINVPLLSGTSVKMREPTVCLEKIAGFLQSHTVENINFPAM